MAIIIKGGLVDNYGGTFMKVDGDYDVDIEGLEIRNYTVGDYRPTTFDIKKAPLLIEQLGLPKHTKPKELYDLLDTLKDKPIENHSQIIKESLFFRTLSIAADATAVIPVVSGLVINPNFQHIMTDLYKLVVAAT